MTVRNWSRRDREERERVEAHAFSTLFVLEYHTKDISANKCVRLSFKELSPECLLNFKFKQSRYIDTTDETVCSHSCVLQNGILNRYIDIKYMYFLCVISVAQWLKVCIYWIFYTICFYLNMITDIVLQTCTDYMYADIFRTNSIISIITERLKRF